jgi:hypothetical protein
VTKIRDFLDDIRTRDLVLPEYVWTRDQAKQLMVSLVKSYPIGGLLICNRVLQDYRAIAADWSQPGVEMIKTGDANEAIKGAAHDNCDRRSRPP